MSVDADRWGWVSDLAAFYDAEPERVCGQLETFIRDSDPAQRAAWRRMVPALQGEVGGAIDRLALAREFGLVLEYELPREGGRRPDVLLLQNGVILVLEFKETHEIAAGAIDQVAGYARDLRDYHSQCRGLSIVPVLVPTRIRGPRRTIRNVIVCPPDLLHEMILEFARLHSGTDVIRAERWLQGKYAPTPGLVAAARELFYSRALPAIQRAEAAGLPQLHSALLAICHEAAANRTRHLVLVTGVPGSGKTIAGLRLAHAPELAAICQETGRSSDSGPAVFLSGNRPLVEVLQDALKNKQFVVHLRNYVKEFGIGHEDRVPAEPVVIFDEAQRAWDAETVSKHHKHTSPSEPEVILRIASQIDDWAVVVALVGSGQEIYKGEERGLGQWGEALSAIPNGDAWVVHGPASLRSTLPGVRVFRPSEWLGLTVTLRSHSASAVDRFVSDLLEGGPSGLERARELARVMKASGFALLMTRSLDTAKGYVQRRYDWSMEKRYGLLASSMAKNLLAYGIDLRAPQAKYVEIGPWYNDPPGSYRSCCSLAIPISEFKAQGLELDLPILCWGDDLVWTGATFRMPKRKRRPGIHDEATLRTNAYRVLLTRGRDGVCIVVPQDAGDGMDATAEALLQAGFDQLEEPIVAR